MSEQKPDKGKKGPTASQVARKVEAFQKKRAAAQARIEAIQRQLEALDQQLVKYLGDVPSCV